MGKAQATGNVALDLEKEFGMSRAGCVLEDDALAFLEKTLMDGNADLDFILDLPKDLGQPEIALISYCQRLLVRCLRC